ncbi:MAG: hypothetical protein ACI81R_003795 [Bradymonadia bacterium]|jgi:hypothetical protein
MTRESEPATERPTAGNAPSEIPAGHVEAVLFSADGRRVVFCFSLGVWLFDAESGRGAPVIHRGVMGYGGAISESGHRFVVADFEATTIHRVSVDDEGKTTNRPLPCEALADDALLICELSPDGRWLVLGTQDGDVSVLSWESDIVEHHEKIESTFFEAVFEPDGSALRLLGDDAEEVNIALAPSPESGIDGGEGAADSAGHSDHGLAASDNALADHTRPPGGNDGGDLPYRVRGERALFIERAARGDGYMITVRTRSRTVVLGPPGGVPLRDVYDAEISWNGERVWLYADCPQPNADCVLVYNADSGDWLGSWQGLVNEESWTKLGTAPINPFGFDDGESVSAPAPAPRAAQDVADDIEFDGHSSLLLARLASGVVGRADGLPLSTLRFDDRDAGVRAVRVLAGLDAATSDDKISQQPAERKATAPSQVIADDGSATTPLFSAEELAQAEILTIERVLATEEEAAPAPSSTVWLRVIWGALAIFALWLLTR